MDKSRLSMEYTGSRKDPLSFFFIMGEMMGGLVEKCGMERVVTENSVVVHDGSPGSRRAVVSYDIYTRTIHIETVGYGGRRFIRLLQPFYENHGFRPIS